MKIYESWKRNKPDSVSGESITVTITYSSFNKNEIDEFEKTLPKGILVMGTKPKTSDILKKKEPMEAKYVGHDGIMLWECPKCRNHTDMFHEGEQVNYCWYCGQKITF